MNLHAGQIIFVIGLLLYLGIRVVFQRRAARAIFTATRSTVLDRALVLFVVIGQILLPSAYLFSPWLNFANHSAHRALTIIGALAWVAGLWLFWRSHVDLGRNWSVTLEVRNNHKLVTQGVYRYIRHPMYAAFLLLSVAQGLLLPNFVAGLSALAAVTLMCLVRVPREEEMMCEFFGNEYHQYMQKTGKFLPQAGLRGVA